MSAGERGLGPVSATFLVAGNMIGSGVYLLPATLAVYGSASLLGWVLGAAGALALAVVYARLARLEPDPDGLVGYPRRTLGRFFGFQAGMLYWAGCWIGNAAIAVAAAGYLAVFLPVVDDSPWLLTGVTLALLWGVTGVVLLGRRAVARVAAGGLVIGLVPVAIATAAGLLQFDPEVFAASWNPGGRPLTEILPPVLVSVFWAFVGLESATAAAAAVRDPGRNVPIAAVGGVGLAAVVYALAVTAVMGVVPADELQRSSAPFAEVAGRVLGPVAAAVVAACALVKAVGGLAGWVLVTAESSRAAASEGLFPRSLSSVDPARLPRKDVLLAAVLMTVSALLANAPTVGESFGVLINVSTLHFLVVYVLSGLALIRMDRSAGPRLAAVFAVLFCGFVTATAPRTEVLILGAVAAAASLAWVFVRRGGRPERA